MARRSSACEQWRAVLVTPAGCRAPSDLSRVVRLLAARAIVPEGHRGLKEPIYFTRGQQRFEVRCEPTPDYAYVGYLDGVRSVAASSADIAMRALIKKHIVGLPEARVVRF